MNEKAKQIWIIPLARPADHQLLVQAHSRSHTPSYEIRAEPQSGPPNFGVALEYRGPNIISSCPS
jgi:hypothetical protein